MSLGIDDPVTRDTFRSDSEYYMGLAQQISDMMVAVLIVSYSFYIFFLINITIIELIVLNLNGKAVSFSNIINVQLEILIMF